LESNRGGAFDLNPEHQSQDSCWVDDSVFVRRNPDSNSEEVWSNGGAGQQAGAFTTGRQGRGGAGGAGRSNPPPPPPAVKPRSQVPSIAPIPATNAVSAAVGKLNLNDFQKVSAALQSKRPLPASEDIDQHGYAVPKDTMGNPIEKSEYAAPVDLQEPKPASRSKPRHRERREQRASHQGEDSDSECHTSSTEDSPQAGPPSGGTRPPLKRERPRKKPPAPAAPQVPLGPPMGAPQGPPRTVAIPVAMPIAPAVIPRLPPPTQVRIPAESEQVEAVTTPSQVSPREEIFPPGKEGDKQRKKLNKEMKAKAKEVERKKLKDEKRKQKEAEKEAKETRKTQKLKASNSIQVQATLDDFMASSEDPIPVFLRMAITFIEREGLDAEGLYRVPGNRAHVDLLFQHFDEDPMVDIDDLDIAVNAVATAVKDFFFKRLPPILEDDHMAELETISLIPDRSIKVLELGKLIKRLPKTNFAVLKFIFQHFVKVTESSKENCMDSKNLAICWWPTLLQYEFGDLGKFEAMRPHLEDIVQTMVDQYRFLFCGQEEVMMV